MADAITPVRVAALPMPAIARRKRSHGSRAGLVACELLSLAALAYIVLPQATRVEWSRAARFLSSWSDLRDAHTTCQQFVRRADSLRRPAAAQSPLTAESWTWKRLDDGRFRIRGVTDRRARDGALSRTRYQCDLIPLTSNGRWRVDSLLVSRERP